MLPRQVLPRQFYMITRRYSQRQFLLRPDRETNNAFIYCLLEAALRCEVEVLLTCAMSNHHHTVIYDRWGRYPEFVAVIQWGHRTVGDQLELVRDVHGAERCPKKGSPEHLPSTPARRVNVCSCRRAQGAETAAPPC